MQHSSAKAADKEKGQIGRDEVLTFNRKFRHNDRNTNNYVDYAT